MKLLGKGIVACWVAVLVSSLFAGSILAQNAHVELPYERHWDETGVNPGDSPIGSDGWYAEDAAFAMVTNVTYTWTEARPPLSNPPSENLQVLQLMEGNTGITNVFTGTEGNTNATVDMLVQLEVSSDEDAARATIEADETTQTAFYLNTNGHMVIYVSVHDGLNHVNQFVEMDDLDPIAEGDWSRVTLKFDYLSDDELLNRYFQITVDGNVYSNTLAFVDPADAMYEYGDPEFFNTYGTWFWCANVDGIIDDKLNAVIFSGTGRVDDYLVYGDQAPTPDPEATALANLVSGTTLALATNDNVVTATVTYPAEIDEVLAGYMTDALITSSVPLVADTTIEIDYNGTVLGTNTLTTSVSSIYLSELLVGAGVSAVRTPITGHAGLTDVWTFTLTSPDDVNTTLTVKSMVSDDNFATWTVLATDDEAVAFDGSVQETEKGTPYSWFDVFGIPIDDYALAANNLMFNWEAHRAGVDPTDPDSVFRIKEIYWDDVEGKWVVTFDVDHHDPAYGLPDFKLQYTDDLTADPVVWQLADTVARSQGELNGEHVPGVGEGTLFFRVIVPADPE